MANPNYITSLATSPVTSVNAAVLLGGPPFTYIEFDSLNTQQKADLATLVAANNGLLPLASDALMYTTILSNGNTWYKTYSSLLKNINELYTSGSASTNTSFTVTTTLQPLLYPSINFKATLNSGTGTTVVNLVDQNGDIIGTFSLDTVNGTVASGLLTELAGQVRYVVVSGTGSFSIVATTTK